MAIPKLYSLARMTTATSGTGTITLGSAATVNSVLYLTFAQAGVSDGDIVAYGIADTNNSEYGYGTYTSAGTTLTRNVIRSTNSNNAISLSGSAQVFITAGNADLVWGFAGSPRNLSITASVAANALTIALKDEGGADPSALSPAYVGFRSATAATGTVTNQPIRTATSLVVSSGSTLGATNGAAFRLTVGVFDDGGTERVGVINATTIGINEGSVASSTAEGGAGAADSANTWYTGSAVTSKAFRIVGYLDYPSGLTTAGTWDAGPTTIANYGAGVVPQVVTPPKVTTYTSGSSAMHTTATGCRSMWVQVWGGGGGGGGSGTSAGQGSDGSTSSFGTLSATGGAKGQRADTSGSGGAGGSGSGGDVNLAGGTGASGTNATSSRGGAAQGAPYLGVFGGDVAPANNGVAAPTNSGGGGGGAGSSGSTAPSGNGGGGGGYCAAMLKLPASTYTYTVGAGGAGGAAGTSGFAGGNGAAGLIIVTEYFT